MELAGEGALLALLEKRRKALAAEGLFALERKRKLPFLPRIVGVVTSPTGAVIRDILHRLEDRCPTRVILWPVAVLGGGLRDQDRRRNPRFCDVRAASRPADRRTRRRIDRGFVALQRGRGRPRCRQSPIPLISAVGHETDTTLIDFAADLRAPTPTAAAEMAVPVRAELFAQLSELSHRGQQCLARRAEGCRERFDLTVCRWPEPQSILAPVVQRVDDLGERLPRSLAARAGNARADMNLVAGRLRRDLIDEKIARLSERLSAAWKMAELVHPERPLSRGFVRVTDRSGKTLTQAADARDARELSLRFGDGNVDTTVDGTAARPARVERPAKRSYLPPQPGLFDQGEE